MCKVLTIMGVIKQGCDKWQMFLLLFYVQIKFHIYTLPRSSQVKAGYLASFLGDLDGKKYAEAKINLY